MIDVKRIVYLLILALTIGLALVHLRTAHTQAVYKMVQLSRQESQLRQDIWQQQVLLSGGIDSPSRLKKSIEQLGLDVGQKGQQ